MPLTWFDRIPISLSVEDKLSQAEPLEIIFYANSLIVPRLAWLSLNSPVALRVGWDSVRHGMWMVPSAFGYPARPLGRRRKSPIQIGGTALVTQCRNLGFIAHSYSIHTGPSSLFIPLSSPAPLLTNEDVF